MAMNRAQKPELLGVAEVVEALGVSESTVWRMIRRGELPTVRERGRRLIPRAAVERLRRREADEGPPPLSSEHPILRLAGAGKSGGASPGARDKYGILSG